MLWWGSASRCRVWLHHHHKLFCIVLCVQGALGRFGAVELSDVAAWVELPDGKVLSGSEAGDLLLWEGGFIKAVISR